MKSFGNWDTQDIHLTFGIQELDNLPDMEVWATHTEDIPEKIAGDLELLRKELLLLNEDAYLVAASWRFVILKEKSYTVLRLDATKKEDLTKIYAMLCWIKKWIHKELNIT